MTDDLLHNELNQLKQSAGVMQQMLEELQERLCNLEDKHAALPEPQDQVTSPREGEVFEVEPVSDDEQVVLQQMGESKNTEPAPARESPQQPGVIKDQVDEEEPYRDAAKVSSCEPPPTEPPPVWQPGSVPQYQPPIARAPAVDWKAILGKLHLWPPSEKGTVEVQLVSWWATRIGALLGVIATVFFGIYITQSMPPWVKFLELLSVSVGVSVVGLWLERKVEKFGAVVFASGLAMIFFSAFAACTVPAVSIVPQLAAAWGLSEAVLAAGVQFAAVALIVGCAVWKDSKVIASMATFLGYVACFFSFTSGLHDFALVAVLLLGAGAVYFYLQHRWNEPLLLSVPLTYALYAIIALFGWHLAGEMPSSLWGCLPYLLLYMILYGAADYVALMRNSLMGHLPRRLVQLFNTTGALGLGFLVTYYHFHADLEIFYFVFGGVLLAASVLYYLSDQ